VKDWTVLAGQNRDTPSNVGRRRAVATTDSGNAVSPAPAPRSTVTNRGQLWAKANLFNGNTNAGAYASAGKADTPDVNHESARYIKQRVRSTGTTNLQQNPCGWAIAGLAQKYPNLLKQDSEAAQQ
jgi:hypothetical protein